MHISRLLTLSKPVRPENWEDKNLQEVFKLRQTLLKEPSISQLTYWLGEVSGTLRVWDNLLSCFPSSWNWNKHELEITSSTAIQTCLGREKHCWCKVGSSDQGLLFSQQISCTWGGCRTSMDGQDLKLCLSFLALWIYRCFFILKFFCICFQ